MIREAVFRWADRARRKQKFKKQALEILDGVASLLCLVLSAEALRSKRDPTGP